MTQEEKDLLLKDLCSRLPYGVKVQIDLQSDIYSPMICKVCNIEFAEMGGSFIGVEVLPDSYCEYREFLCKPYLFPMSSMTEEQRKEFIQCAGYEAREEENGYHYETYYYDFVGLGNVMFPDCDGFDWLNKNHFDYRGLIDKGLAIDATNLNIY
jgi:hypothetical protein